MRRSIHIPLQRLPDLYGAAGTLLPLISRRTETGCFFSPDEMRQIVAGLRILNRELSGALVDSIRAEHLSMKIGGKRNIAKCMRAVAAITAADAALSELLQLAVPDNS